MVVSLAAYQATLLETFDRAGEPAGAELRMFSQGTHPHVEAGIRRQPAQDAELAQRQAVCGAQIGVQAAGDGAMRLLQPDPEPRIVFYLFP